MPRIVDPAARRSQIADAVFALVDRGGIEQASLRNVAQEAGLNIGSVRHYVDGHEGMLIDAVRLMGERVAERIAARLPEFDEVGDDLVAAREIALDLLEQLLPLDEERRREVVVWLAFSERARIAPELREEARVLLDGARQLARPMLQAAGAPHLDLATETLAATVDGLALALIHDPDRLTHAQIREILRVQLAMCLRWGAGGGSRTGAASPDPS